MIEHDIFQPNYEFHPLNKIVIEAIEILIMQAQL